MPIVEAVGVASGSMLSGSRELADKVAVAMRDAALKAQAEGITDIQTLRKLIIEAAEAVKNG